MKTYIFLFVLIQVSVCQAVQRGNFPPCCKTFRPLTTTTLAPEQEVHYDYYLKSAPSAKCGDLMVKADTCIKDALFIGRELKIPETEREIDDYCGKLGATVSCVSSYKPCLAAVPRQLFSILVRDVKKQMKLICSSSVKKRETLDHLKCFNGRDGRQFFYDIVNGVTNVLFNISDPNQDLQTVIPKSCCAYQILRAKAITIADAECKPRTGLETGEFVSDLIKSVVNALTDLACGTYSSTDVCKKLMPRESELYDRLMDEGKTKRYSFSPVLPVIKILNNLDSKKST